jgi:repressor LexA
MAKNNEMFDKIYNFLVDEQAETGVFPSFREIGEKMGLKSTCTISYYLTKLEEQGKIERMSHKSRHIKIVGAQLGAANNGNIETIKKLETQNATLEDENKNLKQQLESIESDDFIEIPLVGQVAAGVPLLATENIEDSFKVPATMFSKGVLFMLTVSGDSMINAGIHNKDRIIVRKQNTAETGEIIVAMVPDVATGEPSATVKRFYKKGDKVILKPENDHLEDMIYNANDVQIVGKVTGLLRNYF